MTAILVAAYLSAIVAANLLVATFGPSVVVVNAFLFIGLDLTARDKLNDAWEGPNLALRMGALIVAGGIISYALNADAGIIAVASTVAFMAATLVDWTVYEWMGSRPLVKVPDYPYWRKRYTRMERVNGSNVASAAVDSVLFYGIAFGGLTPLVLGLFLAKVAGGFVWSLILAVPQWKRAG